MNRACQILELPRIRGNGDASLQYFELSFLYDKIRRQLLQRYLWTFSTRRAALRPIASTTMILAPSPWVAGIYQQGSIVSYQGVIWVAIQNTATGTPGTEGSGWTQYFGPMTVTPWNVPLPSPPNNQASDPNPFLPTITPGEGETPYGAGQGTVGYFTGELAYLPKGDGTYMIFRSTITTAGTTSPTPGTNQGGPNGPNMPDGPLLADPWDAGTIYSQGQLAWYVPSPDAFILGINNLNDGSNLSGVIYQSQINMNVGNEPDLVDNTPGGGAQLTWSSTHAYSAGDNAWGSDNQVYVCLVGNIGNNPVTDNLFAYWQPLSMWVGAWRQIITPNPRAFSNGWQYISGSLSPLTFIYPVQAGPAEDTRTLNAFKLPANYLRMAPADPKNGGIGWLGAPSGGVWYDDQVIEADLLVTQQIQPIIIRFVADIYDVTLFHDLFAEAFAADLAKAGQPILQPKRNDLFARAKAVYDSAIDDAVRINALEMASVEPPVDSLITCRL